MPKGMAHRILFGNPVFGYITYGNVSEHVITVVWTL